MDHFDYRDGELYAEDIAIQEIANAVGVKKAAPQRNKRQSQRRKNSRRFKGAPRRAA